MDEFEDWRMGEKNMFIKSKAPEYLFTTLVTRTQQKECIKRNTKAVLGSNS